MDDILEWLEVGQVWGVGRRSVRMLARHGVHTARQLRDLPDDWLRSRMTVTGLMIALELRGVPCLELQVAPPPSKSILCSRSFGRNVRSRGELAEALAAYASRACEKLRAQDAVAGWLRAFVQTSPFGVERQYAPSRSAALPVATDHTPAFIRAAHRLLDEMYRPGLAYSKAGIMLAGIEPRGARQLSLLGQPCERSSKLARQVDRINERFGRDSVQYAAAGLGRPWRMRQLRKSPRYTTSWQELPVAR